MSARTLRSNKERVRDAIRQCVHQGSRLPAGSLWDSLDNNTDPAAKSDTDTVKNWEREAAVMVGAVASVLG